MLANRCYLVKEHVCPHRPRYSWLNQCELLHAHNLKLVEDVIQDVLGLGVIGIELGSLLQEGDCLVIEGLTKTRDKIWKYLKS